MKKQITLAITGHRDVVEHEVLKQEVYDYLKSIVLNNLEKEIVLLSPLADGADRLVAQIFCDLQKTHDDLSLIVPMPFSKDRYMLDFNESSKEEFLNFLKQADSVFQIPYDGDNAYEELGKYIVDTSDVLLALWDGTYNGKAGGTGDVVSYSKGRLELVHFLCERAE